MKKPTRYLRVPLTAAAILLAAMGGSAADSWIRVGPSSETSGSCLSSPKSIAGASGSEAQAAASRAFFDGASGACAVVGSAPSGGGRAGGLPSSRALASARMGTPSLSASFDSPALQVPTASLASIDAEESRESVAGFFRDLWGHFLSLQNGILNVLPMSAGDWVRRLVDYYGLIGVRPGDWDGYVGLIERDGGARKYSKNKVEFLVDGENVLPKLYEAIDGAKESIDLQSFQYEACSYESGPKGVPCDRASDVGWRLAERLAEKVKQGVHVRLLMDQFGTEDGANRKELDDFLTFLSSSGIEWAYHPKPLLVDHLDHRKLYVFDGRVGFVGGMNIGNDYQVYWHDQLTRVEGPAVRGLQEAFLEKWADAGRKISTEETAALLRDPEPVPDGIDLWLVLHEGGFWNDKHIKRDYLLAIAAAEKSVRIADPYLSDPDVMAALRKAALRGVQVQLILPAHNDQALLQRAERSYYADLLAVGVEIYEYSARPMAHDKVAVIDGRWATFGSSNLDDRSLGYNDEINAVLLDPRPDGVAREIEAKLFDPDIRNSRRITDAGQVSATWPQRLRQWADAVLSFLT